ncbi:hypothetical protein [Metabacillus idriensis]|uniref:hypothetical protein n=1 Tax=Metabacillus idriensis TaxID=324768 RepID=UPI0017497FF9|nr:hypothetical protein [Metabacillus idriensis]
MKWSTVREICPNQFVKLTALSSKVIDNKEVIEDVALIELIDDKDATKELLKSKGAEFVYHTFYEDIVLEIRQNVGSRKTER